ncbi:MAG TPA: hypothetical protein VFG76_07660 [Candidatus Polarisedimenticolia bacterium]|nr:hypothetical protein [Candidatus Polarisedimenticolia bacterium]
MGNFDFESGRRLVADGDLAEGIRCLLASLDLDPSNTEAYLELFAAYEHAWHESADPMVLDQMRKVALAGLRRGPTADQRRFLEEGLDRADALILEVQREEAEAEREAAGQPTLHAIKPPAPRV